MSKSSKSRKWTPERRAAASAAAKERHAAKSFGDTGNPDAVRMNGGSEGMAELERLRAENERLKATVAQQTLGMTVLKEDEPTTPAKFKDDDDWHYYLCIKSKADEEDEEAEKCSRDPEKGGYEMAPNGRISARKVWLRIPQRLFQARKQKAIDEARGRWQRPPDQDVRDGLIQRREQTEQYVTAGQPAGAA